MEFFTRLFEIIGDAFNSFSAWIENKLTNMFGSANARFLKKLQPIVEQINAKEDYYKALTDEELREMTPKLRKRLADGETLDDILPDAFAVCREAGQRVLGMRHYDVQLIGGMVLHSGAIAEMITGEGKTLVATLPAYLNALEGKGVHVVTVNDYLARRDMEWMGPLYLSLGITVGTIQSNMPADERQAAYLCDITYGTNNEFGFDYLRDNMRFAAKGDDRFPKQYQQVQGKLNFAIVDEVDNILIDEARTPLIISGLARSDTVRYAQADKIARQLIKGTDFEVNEKDHTANLTDEGVRHAEHLAGVESFYTAGNMEWPHLIDNALKAHYLYKRDVNYVVDNGEIIIVDEFTGRKMEGRQWSDGLHQAVEAKEEVRVKEETQTLATITLQNYFKLYEKIAGMTGTAMTEASEFLKIYKLEVIAIPPNKTLQRQNFVDQIYRTEKEKYEAIVKEVEKLNKWDVLEFDNGDREVWGTIVKNDETQLEFQPKGSRETQVIPKDGIEKIQPKGRPVLVGTVSIERSELISDMLDRKGIKHQVLNAKYHQHEAEIVAQAGRKGAVTIATNMAGRGTDIILGGNPDAMAWGILQANYPTRLDVPREEWDALVHEIEQREHMKTEGELIRSMGGLHIIGSERHEARRIDLQLRGRCGRQGDPGSSRFFLSLEDDLMRIFAGEWVKNILGRLGMEEGQPIESRMVSRRIEGAQKKVEERNFDVRKSLLEYDEVMDYQRKRVYGYRQRILDGANCKSMIFEMIDRQIDLHINAFLDHDYGAASFAAWAGNRLAVEFEPKDFRGMNFDTADEYAHDQASRYAEIQVLDMVEENLPKDVEETEWNWQALARNANTRWKLSVRERDLQQVGRSTVDEYLIKRAQHYIEKVDLSQGKLFLEPNFGATTACNWIKTKFGLALDSKDYENAEAITFREMLYQMVHEHYHRKELQFPVYTGLLHFTVRDFNGVKRYDREKLAAWASQRFGVQVNVEELKNMQRDEIRDLLFEKSARTETQLATKAKELRTDFLELLEAQGNNEEDLKQDRLLIDRYNPKLDNFCEILGNKYNYVTSPIRLSLWKPEEIQDHLDAIAEDWYNPEMRKMERSLVLQILDAAWKDHLLVMDHLRSSVGLRGYAQVDPKVEYKREGMRIFESMWDAVFDRVTDYIFRVEQLDEEFIGSAWEEGEARHDEISGTAATEEMLASRQPNSIVNQQQQAIEQNQSGKKSEPYRNKIPQIGRNEPCPCGSGKKYKKCCGKK
ncbi:MAG: SEC-C domain-containing protein [Planctomycetaceae bacterium]|jgi:preprotein translocase subunit SecA|nr:SEC-C domain-containing protein [Planctomycetaceae bacterium]